MYLFRFIIWFPISCISLLLGLFQFIFILCHVAQNLIHGTSFLVPIVKVFITVINMNGVKTSCDAESVKSVVHSIHICFSQLLSTVYVIHVSKQKDIAGIVLSLLQELQPKP